MNFGRLELDKQISQELSHFFKFANDKNPNVVIETWKKEEEKSIGHETRTRRIFLHCVSCNTERFSRMWSEIQKNPKSINLGTNTYFCQPCVAKVAKLGESIENRSSEAGKRLQELWNQNLFGPLRSGI